MKRFFRVQYCDQAISISIYVKLCRITASPIKIAMDFFILVTSYPVIKLQHINMQ